MAAVISTRPNNDGGDSPQSVGSPASDLPPCPIRPPTLAAKVDVGAPVSDAAPLAAGDGLLAVCDDRSLRVYLKRDSGVYWPSVCHYLQAPCTCLEYNEQARRAFVGTTAGYISEFIIADDYNSLEHRRDYHAHSSSASGVRLSVLLEWVISCGADRRLVWHCSETGRRLGSYECAAPAAALQVDEASRYAFVGDAAGNVAVLQIASAGPDGTGAACQLITNLSAHNGTVRSLAWDADRKLLFSGSFDKLIIVWDIGSKKGTAYELNGHTARVTGLGYHSGRLISVDDGGEMLVWDMSNLADRQETPAWRTSDSCERCDTPFFWNVSVMWNRKTVGTRQHHCRLCGAAVCAGCSSKRSTYPKMGYELPVRLCDGCERSLKNRLDDQPDKLELRPTAVRLRSGSSRCLALAVDPLAARLLTVGNDRAVRLWQAGETFAAR